MAENSLNRIFLVEDDPDIQEIVLMTLKDLGGYAVDICSSGQEALDKIVGIQPDLILLDVMMPEMDGPTTLRAIRAMSEVKDTPVIFMTARSQTHEVAEYMELGAIDVIRKPFDPVTLCNQIENIWDRYNAA
ncbi:MAG: response regulator [Rhodospirillaceae bacterium]|jgi:two-component system, OmpR family, response regulator|nr:response regulator [Rhodospirillaceae bacterium]MBT7770627.1 response regulator [Rhodospirillales bacterium]MBT4700820.1 response regulator [Rhodospirillaceae bacterium]MBT5036844.1 response regulator [Rhodospirillaceae bacterium]MBT6219537.1 response regulator [Rhodospirillaceae bacterium]